MVRLQAAENVLGRCCFRGAGVLLSARLGSARLGLGCCDRTALFLSSFFLRYS